MSKYVAYKEVARLALEAIGILNTEWAMLVQGLPTIEIVHCGECAKRKKNGFCLEHMRYEKNDNGFCSYGEILVKSPRKSRESHEKDTEQTCETCEHYGVVSAECDRCDKTSYSRWVRCSEKANSLERNDE